MFEERLEWKLFKIWNYFQTLCLCNSCARKIRNLGTLFEVIQNAIGSESAVSQNPPKQSINLCKRLLQTPSVLVARGPSVSEKASHKSLRSAVGSGQQWSSWVNPEHRRFTSWRGTSGRNSDSELVWESHYKNSPIETRNAGHAQMNIPDLIDRFITWQSTPPRRANQENPFVDKRVFQNREVCG